MAYFRCTGGTGGGFIEPVFSGIFGTTSGLLLKAGKWLSGFANNNLFYPRTQEGTAPTYDQTKNRHIHIRFKIAGTISTESQGLMGTLASSDRHAPQINVYPQNNANFCVIGWSSDGSTNTTWMTFSKNEIAYSNDKEYTIDATWSNNTLTGVVSDGTNTTTKTATDGNQYIVSTDSDKIALGIRRYNNIYSQNLVIDIADTYWEENGVILWGNSATT